MRYVLTLCLTVVVVIVFSLSITQPKPSPSSDLNGSNWQSSSHTLSPTKRVTTATVSLSPTQSQGTNNIAPGNHTTPNTTVLGATAPPASPTPLDTPTPTPAIGLSLLSPTGDMTTSLPQITITGKTAPSAEVFVNDQSLHSNTLGIFTTVIPLEAGDNLITISANDAVGHYNEQEIVVTYNKP